VQWLQRPAETACVHMNHCIICNSVPLRTNLANEHGQQLCCACDGQLTTKLDMRAAKCNVAQPCSVTLAPHSTAAQKKATMPSGQHSAQAAMRLLTAVPNGGPSCSTEPAICTNAVSGRKQTCVAAEGVCFSCLAVSLQPAPVSMQYLADEDVMRGCVAHQEVSYSCSDGVLFGKPKLRRDAASCKPYYCQQQRMSDEQLADAQWQGMLSGSEAHFVPSVWHVECVRRNASCGSAHVNHLSSYVRAQRSAPKSVLWLQG
jgi:hypothetical protein